LGDAGEKPGRSSSIQNATCTDRSDIGYSYLLGDDLLSSKRNVDGRRSLDGNRIIHLFPLQQEAQLLEER